MHQKPKPTEEFLHKLIQAEHNYLEGSTDPRTCEGIVETLQKN